MGVLRDLAFNDPPKLRNGSLVILPVVNIYGLERHSRYMPDRRDPNRCFPGIAGGSLTSRLAHAVFHQVVKQCDYGVDFHSAAVRRTNYPNVRAWMRDPGVRKIAEAFGSELIVHSRGPSGSLRRTAVEAGVPTIILEAGEVWKIEPGVVEIGKRGVMNVLKSLGMVAGEPKRPAFQIRINKTTWVRSPLGGLVVFHYGAGALVKKDQVLATVHSFFGREEMELRSPVDGMVLGVSTMPVVKPGGPVYHVAALTRARYELVERRLEARSRRNPYARIRTDLATNIAIQENEENGDASQ
jgi:hypothetical protein